MNIWGPILFLHFSDSTSVEIFQVYTSFLMKGQTVLTRYFSRLARHMLNSFIHNEKPLMRTELWHLSQKQKPETSFSGFGALRPESMVSVLLRL